jgi:hypothetical protein
MGWTYTHKTKGSSIKDFFQTQFGGCVVDCKVVNLREAYLAVQHGDKVFAVVALLHYDNKSYHNFGYKDMDETMHPYYYNCPRSIRNLLTPTDNIEAITWRNKCIENEVKLACRKEAIAGGAVVHFEKGFSFGRYGKAFTFTCTDAKKLHFFAHEIGIEVRLRKNSFLGKDFTIVK